MTNTTDLIKEDETISWSGDHKIKCKRKSKNTSLVRIMPNSDIRVSTFNLWMAFGYKDHKSLKKVIYKNIERFKARGELIEEKVKLISAKKMAEIRIRNSGAGRYEAGFLLNTSQFRLLVSLVKTTTVSIQLSDNIEKMIGKMERSLLNIKVQQANSDWLEARKQGKTAHSQYTDAIKDFAAYAESQGSKSSKMYFIGFPRLVNSTMLDFQGEFPTANLRNMLPKGTLRHLEIAELAIIKIIRDGIELKTYYKEIYQAAKAHLEKLVYFIGKATVTLGIASTPLLAIPSDT